MRLCQIVSGGAGSQKGTSSAATRVAPTSLILTGDLSGRIPPYAILSHTWSLIPDQEVTFHDLSSSREAPTLLPSGSSAVDYGFKSGWNKLRFCAERTLQSGDGDGTGYGGVRHFWVDTCCIDRANLVELSEAITSMWRWYQASKRCWVFLEDVSVADGEDFEMSFRQSRWWTRGWTLQELLAPKEVEFFSREGRNLGDKRSLEGLIHDITGIPVSALRGEDLSQFSVDERLGWSHGRQTKKVEDKAYCLLGIFDISMSLRYGEGEKALARLESKVRGGSARARPETPLSSQQSDISDRSGDASFLQWLAPSRPEAIHAKVSSARHPGTGVDFTDRLLREYVLSESSRALMVWISGKTGTGKTTLFSYIVDATKRHTAVSLHRLHMLEDYKGSSTVVLYHYCTFSDPDSQQPINILGSFAVQLSAWQPAILNDLQRFYGRDKSRNGEKSLQLPELEGVLVKRLANFAQAIVLLDALNESDDFTVTLACINGLLTRLPNLTVLVTTTRSAMTAGTERWPRTVEIHMNPDEDIRAVLDFQLAPQGPLGHLSAEARERIRNTLSEDADSTFRWVALTLDNLRRQRTGKAVLKALAETPSGLNNTYAAMLRAIPAMDRPIAREALMWLSFALRPLSLLELSEAAVLEDGDTTLDQDSRLRQPEVLLEICHGFISHDTTTLSTGKGEVKLAHASVKEYLLSDHARSDAGDDFFALDANKGNETLMKRCLTYLMFDDFSSGVAPNQIGVMERQKQFPLLNYAAFHWGLHASSTPSTSSSSPPNSTDDPTNTTWTTLAHQFFATRSLPRAGNYGAWVSCLIPESAPGLAMKTEPLYYASSFGVLPLVNALLLEAQRNPSAVNIEAPGGRFRSTALQVATFRGRKAVSEVLFRAGADFWSPDRGSGAPAWFWVLSNGWDELLVEMVRRKPKIKSHELWSAATDLRVKRQSEWLLSLRD